MSKWPSSVDSYDNGSHGTTLFFVVQGGSYYKGVFWTDKPLIGHILSLCNQPYKVSYKKDHH